MRNSSKENWRSRENRQRARDLDEEYKTTRVIIVVEAVVTNEARQNDKRRLDTRQMLQHLLEPGTRNAARALLVNQLKFLRGIGRASV